MPKPHTGQRPSGQHTQTTCRASHQRSEILKLADNQDLSGPEQPVDLAFAGAGPTAHAFEPQSFPILQSYDSSCRRYNLNAEELLQRGEAEILSCASPRTRTWDHWPEAKLQRQKPFPRRGPFRTCRLHHDGLSGQIMKILYKFTKYSSCILGSRVLRLRRYQKEA